jgi:hypothetical protein
LPVALPCGSASSAPPSQSSSTFEPSHASVAPGLMAALPSLQSVF